MATKVETLDATSARLQPLVQIHVKMSVNGKEHDTAVACDLLLIDFLRDTLGLTGAKFGCETGQCGSCTVLVDGMSVKSCAILAAQVDGSTISTVEGLADGATMTALQTSLHENHAVQCGYCTPGILMSLQDLLHRTPKPGEADIRRALDGNLCRCGVYQNVVNAVLSLTAASE